MDDSLISRAVLRDAVSSISMPWDFVDAINAIAAINTLIDEAPAVDAAPVVHAYWRTVKDGSLECTNCLGLSPHDENYNGDITYNYETDFCPWCGAKMDGGAEP